MPAYRSYSNNIRGDYIAKDILLEFLKDPVIKSKVLINDSANLEDPAADDKEDFVGLLISRSISLAERLVNSLVVENLESSNNQHEVLNSSIVLDGDLG